MRRHAGRILAVLLRTRLRVDAFLSRFSANARRPRVLVLGTGVLPVYSHTFVYQEMCALAEHGFTICAPYLRLDDRQYLAPRVSRLWALKRRLMLAPGAAIDWRHYRRRMPEKVAALTRAVCDASGLSENEVNKHAHFLQAFSFARAAEAWRADYIHSYFFYDWTLYALVASWLLDIPRGVSCYADHALTDYPFKIVTLNLDTCDVVVATSQRIRRELEAIGGGVPRPNIVVKPNAIDSAEFTSDPRRAKNPGEPATLSCVCRIDPKKGLQYLIDAVRLLLDRGVQVRLRVVGEPEAHLASSLDYARELQAQVVALHLEQVVQFEGRRPSPDVRQLLHDTDVFVAPFVELESGDKDGIPTALLEAMASSCAIVTTDAGSISEVVDDGQTALVVPQRDTERLASAIARLIDDASLHATLGQAALVSVRERFDVSTSEALLHDRVRRAIEERQLRGYNQSQNC